MKRHEPQRIDAIIRAAVQAAGNTDSFNRARASYLWPEVMGPSISRATTRRWVDGTTLHVAVASASLRSDLTYLADTICRKINQAAGQQLITRIVIH